MRKCRRDLSVHANCCVPDGPFHPVSAFRFYTEKIQENETGAWRPGEKIKKKRNYDPRHPQQSGHGRVDKQYIYRLISFLLSFVRLLCNIFSAPDFRTKPQKISPIDGLGPARQQLICKKKKGKVAIQHNKSNSVERTNIYENIIEAKCVLLLVQSRCRGRTK